MITAHSPTDWRDLQEQTARTLSECGFQVEVEAKVDTVRGKVELDVLAEEDVDGRRYRIFCECKHWQARVPQTVIHSFRTVVADSGANVGYIISAAGFQSGAFTAAELTNLRLVTWEEFQAEFEQTWIERFLLQHVVNRIDPLFSYIEPILPRGFDELTEEEQDHYMALKDKYDEFGWLMMQFTKYHRATDLPLPELPLRGRVTEALRESNSIPPEVLDAPAYREFLDVALPYGERAVAEFRRAMKRDT